MWEFSAAIGVGLEFVVAPAVAAEVVGPFFRIGGGAVGGVEFVGPDESEIFRVVVTELRGVTGVDRLWRVGMTGTAVPCP